MWTVTAKNNSLTRQFAGAQSKQMSAYHAALQSMKNIAKYTAVAYRSKQQGK